MVVGVGVVVGGGGVVVVGISCFDYLCQQWFRKLIVSYLHQYQTFLVKTTRSEWGVGCVGVVGCGGEGGGDFLIRLPMPAMV